MRKILLILGCFLSFQGWGQNIVYNSGNIVYNGTDIVYSTSGTPEVVASYTPVRDAWWYLNNTAPTAYAVAQSFQSPGNYKLTSCKFFTDMYTATQGTVVAKLYAHSGVFGSTSIPTGSALATSDSVNATALAEGDYTEFLFSGANQVNLTNGTYYCIALEVSGMAAVTYIVIGSDQTDNSYAGNESSLRVGDAEWGEWTGDLMFYVYGTPQ